MILGVNGRFYAARLTGVQRVARGLCAELYARCNVSVFLPADAPADDIPPHVRVLRGSLTGHAWEQFELPAQARAAGTDLVLHPANTAPRLGGLHAIVVHDVLPLTQPQWFARGYVLWQQHMIRPAIARAEVIYTFTEWSAHEIVRACGVARERVHVLTQGLAPFTAPATAENVQAVLKRYALAQPYFLCLGPDDPRKNIELLISVLGQLRTSLAARPELVAVGRPAARIQARRRILLPSWVRVIEQPGDADLCALYTGALALCFPSHAEGFGRPPLEALACGTPAVVSDYNAARELLGAAVPLLPPQPAQWQQLLHLLLDSPVERQRLVQRGAPLLPQFTWARAAEQLLAALDNRPASRTLVV